VYGRDLVVLQGVEKCYFGLEEVNEGMNLSLKSGLGLESMLAAMTSVTEDAEEGIKAFLEKRNTASIDK
jgi:enoyl-CoA hydratase/carnithine racemase